MKDEKIVCFSVNAWVCFCGLHKRINEWALFSFLLFCYFFRFHLILQIIIAKCALLSIVEGQVFINYIFHAQDFVHAKLF